MPRSAPGRGQVWWVPDALTYDEEPVTFRQSLVQRRRWCSGVMSVAVICRLWRRVPSRNFFLLLGLRRVSLPMVQVLALLPGLWAVAQAVLLENWLALALSLASFWGGMTLTALALALAGRRKLRPCGSPFCLYPLFTASWYPPTYSGCFPEDQGLEAHCPPWSDGPAAGELGAVSDRGWGERRAYYDHGRLRRAREEAGLSQRQVCGAPDHLKPAVPAGA